MELFRQCLNRRIDHTTWFCTSNFVIFKHYWRISYVTIIRKKLFFIHQQNLELSSVWRMLSFYSPKKPLQPSLVNHLHCNFNLWILKLDRTVSRREASSGNKSVRRLNAKCAACCTLRKAKVRQYLVCTCLPFPLQQIYKRAYSQSNHNINY